jgi:flagellum-specific ATP synthase
LVEADDFNEPIADLARSILDGHIVLSRRLATANFFPAIDVLESISRVMSEVVSSQHLNASYAVREILATYREAQDLINLGAYVKGNNPRIDRAIALIDRVHAFLQQRTDEATPFEETLQRLLGLINEKASDQ